MQGAEIGGASCAAASPDDCHPDRGRTLADEGSAFLYQRWRPAGALPGISKL